MTMFRRVSSLDLAAIRAERAHPPARSALLLQAAEIAAIVILAASAAGLLWLCIVVGLLMTGLA